MSQSAAQKLERIKEQKALTPEPVIALRPSFRERVRGWAKRARSPRKITLQQNFYGRTAYGTEFDRRGAARD